MITWFFTNGTGNGEFIHRVGPFGIPSFAGAVFINRHSFVLANICEIARIPGEPQDLPWMGDAAMEVRNIVPADDGFIYIRIRIDFHTPLNYRLGIAVFNRG